MARDSGSIEHKKASSGKNTYSRWMLVLLVSQAVNLLPRAFSLIPGAGVISILCLQLASVCRLLCLFQLSHACARYRTAAALQCIPLILFFTRFIPAVRPPFEQTFLILSSLCTLAAAFYEYSGHADVIASKTPVLAAQWRRLFVIQLLLAALEHVGTPLFYKAVFPRSPACSIIYFVVFTITGVLFQIVYIRHLLKMYRFTRA